MKKIFLFDADGVVITPQGYGTAHAFEQAGLDPSLLGDLWTGPFDACKRGEQDLMDVLPNLLESWGWKDTAQAFLDIWFSYEHVLDKELLAYIQGLRQKGYKCYMTTDQEKHRAAYIRKEMNFETLFDGMYVSCEIGATKGEQAFFTYVHNDLKEKHGEIASHDMFFVDDTQGKIDAANEYGIDAVLFETREQCIEEIEKRI